jgi:glycerol-3-phosphate acyltransferase PlsY
MSVLQTAARYVLCAAQSYLFGSLNTGIILSKNIYHTDLRKEGSGNAGATNMARTFGWEAGALVLAGDMLKTEAAVAIGCKLVPGMKGLTLSGLSCLVGHCLPAFYEHRGGKGVSVGAALALILDPKVFSYGILTFLVGALTSHKVSVGSLAAAASLPVSAALSKKSTLCLVFTGYIAAIIVYRHRGNILRLLKREEPDFHFGNAVDSKA